MWGDKEQMGGKKGKVMVIGREKDEGGDVLDRSIVEKRGVAINLHQRGHLLPIVG